MVVYHRKLSNWNLFELLNNSIVAPVIDLYFIDGNEFVVNSKEEYNNK